jgi:hypothetical protein
MPRAAFGPLGLHQFQYAYAVDYSDKEQRVFVSPQWHVDNWVYDELSQGMSRRSGPEFEGEIFSDFDENGDIETEQNYFLDLEMRHLQNDGRIWVHSRALAKNEEQTDLNIVLEEYADRLSGAELQNVLRGTRTKNSVHTYATHIESKDRVQFGPYDALIATVTVANLEQLRLNPAHRYGVITILLVKIAGKFVHYLNRGTYEADKGLLTIGLFSLPEYYNENLPDFYTFLNQFSFQGVQVAPLTPPVPAGLKKASETIPRESSESDTGPETVPDGDSDAVLEKVLQH